MIYTFLGQVLWVFVSHKDFPSPKSAEVFYLGSLKGAFQPHLSEPLLGFFPF